MATRPPPADRLACGTLVLLALVATRWTPHPPVRSALLLLAAIGMGVRLRRDGPEDSAADPASTGGNRFGELCGDLSDSVADVMIFAGAGVCAGGTEGPLLGLGAGIGCLTTAYVRVLGRAVGARPHHVGPMASEHRMAVLSVACVVGAVVVFFGRWLHVWMVVPLGMVIVGCVSTTWRRLRRIVVDLNAGSAVAE